MNKTTLKRSTVTEVVTKYDKDGTFLERCLPEPDQAKVFRAKDGELLPFRIDLPQVVQEYEKDPFTAEQTAEYKKALYSERGRKLLNNLKNSKLITESQFRRIIELCAPSFLKSMENKFIKALFSKPKFTKFKVVRANDELNKISLKDLGIEKRDVIDLFRTERLVNF